MEYTVVMSGFGGQGVLLMGDLLAYSAMKAGLQVTWMPSYGVEMRGGTANCTVVVSDEKIGSPIVDRPTAVLAMNLPAMEKFQAYLPSGGLLLVNSTIVKKVENPRDDVKIIMVPTQKLAEEAGDKKMSNIAMLGAFLGASNVLSVDFIEECLDSFLPAERKKLLPRFGQTLRLGKDFVNGNFNQHEACS